MQISKKRSRGAERKRCLRQAWVKSKAIQTNWNKAITAERSRQEGMCEGVRQRKGSKSQEQSTSTVISQL